MIFSVLDSVDAALAVQGLKRDQVLEMPSYLMLPPLLEALRAALAPQGHRGEITTDWLGE